MTKTFSDRARWMGGLFAGMALLGGAACGGAGEDGTPVVDSRTPEPEDAGPSGWTCTDHDGDGFGQGCTAGPDCDDGDPAITTQCTNRCSHDAVPGCPCKTEGKSADCGRVEVKVAGAAICGPGISYCQNGKWTDCELAHGRLDGGDGTDEPLH